MLWILALLPGLLADASLACDGALSAEPPELLAQAKESESLDRLRHTLIEGFLTEYEGEFKTFARLDVEGSVNQGTIVQLESPKISTFGLRLARYRDRELIDFSGNRIDQFHTSYPFARDIVRVRGNSDALQLNRERNTLVSERESGRKLAPFNIYLPTDLVDRVLVDDPILWILPNINSSERLGPEAHQGLEAGVQWEAPVLRRLADGNLMRIEAVTHEGVRIKGKPTRAVRTLTFSPARRLVAAVLEVNGRTVQKWSIEWQSDQSGDSVIASLVADHQFYMSADDVDGHLMATAKYVLQRRVPVTDDMVATLFTIEVSPDAAVIQAPVRSDDGARRSRTRPLGTPVPGPIVTWLLYGGVALFGTAALVLVIRSGRRSAS